jgi:acetyl-CoA acetyltransferase
VGIIRGDTDALGLLSQQRSALALKENRFAGQFVPIDVPDRGPDGRLSARRPASTATKPRERRRLRA